MKKIFSISTLLVLALGLISIKVSAQTLIAGWDFQTTTNGGTAAAAAPGSPTVYAANFGSGKIYLNGTIGSSTWVTATSGNEVTSFGGTAVNAGSGFSTSTTSPACLALVGGTSNSANGKRIVFQFSMTGYQNLMVSYATQGTSTGFTTQTWEYSTDGTNYTTIQAINPIPTSFTVETLPLITALNGTATAYLRFTGTGASSTSGNNRLDNIQFNATAVSSSPVLSISPASPSDHGSACPSTATSAITYTITNSGSVPAAGVTATSNDPQFVVTTSVSPTTIPASGGTATYKVTFTPSSAGAKSATITVSSTTSGSNSPTSSLTGTGTTPVAQAVSTSAATSITSSTATLNGNVTTLGICPATIEKGFVYSLTSANTDPVVGGTGVTKVPVGSSVATGVYTQTLTGLSSTTGYSFKAYVYNGTSYTYGAVTTLTTTGALSISGTASNGSSCPGVANSPVTYTITNSGAVAATGITLSSSDGQFVVSSPSSTTIAANGGTATFTVTFTPASPGSKSSLITLNSTNVASVNTTVTGTGNTPVTPVVTSSAATSVVNTTATLNGNVTTLGTCPATSEKGFVYSQTGVNANPIVGGTGVTKTSVSGAATGTYTLALTGLMANTGYSYKAYVYNGTTYIYSSIITFTTLSAAAKLVFGIAPPSSGSVGTSLTTFTVQAQRSDNSVDVEYTGTVTLTRSVVSGSGNLTGMISVAAVSGVATFNDVQFDGAGTFIITASSGTLTSVTSGNIVINVVIVAWDFNGLTGYGPSPFNPSTTASNTTATGLTRGSGVTTSGTAATDGWGGNGWNFTTEAAAITAKAYVTFTIKPNIGSAISLSSINPFEYRRSSSGATSGALQYSTDGTNFIDITSSINYSSTSSSGSTIAAIDLTGIVALQNIPASTTVTFRIVNWGASSASGTWYLFDVGSDAEVNDFGLNGNVNCITPVAYAVTGGGSYCSGGTGVTIGLANSQVGINYQLKVNGNNTGLPVAGTGTAISFGNQTAPGTYTATGINNNGACNISAAMSGSVMVTVNPTVTAGIVSGTSPLCIGATATYSSTGTSGGTWSSNTDVATVNATSGLVTALAAGTTDITYTVNSGCGSPVSAFKTLTVNVDTWTGATSTAWNVGSNWSCGVPTSATDVSIPNGAPRYPLVSGSYSVRGITIGSAASLTIDSASAGVLTITGAYSNAGVLTNNGRIVLNGALAQTFPGGSVANLSMNTLEVSNTSGVTLDQSITIRGAILPTAGTLALGNNYITLRSDSINTGGTPQFRSARIGVDGSATPFTYGNGRFVIERYFHAKRAWRLITAPITKASSSTIFNGWQLGGRTTSSAPPAAAGSGVLITGNYTPTNGFDNNGSNKNPSLKIFEPTTGALNSVVNTKPMLLSPGTYSTTPDKAENIGYFNFVRGDRDPSLLTLTKTGRTTLRDTGIVQTGVQSFTFPLASNTMAKFVLLPNPYASPVDFQTIYNTNQNNIEERFYAWDPELGDASSVGGYVTYDLLSGATPNNPPGHQTQYIQSTQAVYLQTSNATTVTVTVNESDKTGDTINAPLFRPLIYASSQLAVNLKFLNTGNNTLLADGILAQFSSAYSDAVDKNDGLKFLNPAESFAFARDGKLLSIERRNQVTKEDTLFFNFTKGTKRSYQLEFVPDGLEGTEAYLLDSYLKTSTPVSMSQTSTVNFSITDDAGSAAADRFMIVFRPSATLPVTFTKVKAYQQGSNINVEWNIENEVNIKQYEVERSTDGRIFSKSITLTATRNNGTTAAYSWPDASPVNGANYYRIKSISKTGEVQYSLIVKVTIGNGRPMIAVYPNPITGGTINLQLTNQPAGKYGIRLLDKLGQVILSRQTEHAEGSSTESLEVSKAMAHGNYQLEITKPDNNKIYINVLY